MNITESLVSTITRLSPRATLAEIAHTIGGIPRCSPTLLPVAQFSAYVWQSGQDAHFSLTCGCTYRVHVINIHNTYNFTSKPLAPESCLSRMVYHFLWPVHISQVCLAKSFASLQHIDPAEESTTPDRRA
jgi:hypothetical protein